MTELRSGSATDIGLVRANNQDQLLVAAPLFAVADGMGGHAAGEVASALAVKTLEEALSAADTVNPAALVAAALTANRAIWDQSATNSELRGMGTTLVAMSLVPYEGADRLAIVNVGDSRLYRMRHDRVEQLTADHSLVAELVAEGQLAEEEAEFHPQRNVLTRALGVDPEVVVDLLTETPEPGDRYVLCSDGLYREVSDDQIGAILRRLADPGDAARELVSEAKLRGGSDNISVVVVDVVAEHESVAPSEDPGEMTAEVATGLAAPVETEEPVSVEAPKLSRRARRKQNKADRPAQARLVTVRVVGFFVLLLIIVVAAAGALAWYARDSYFVGLQGNQLTIFQGRPGGVLWFHPTIAERTNATTGDVASQYLPSLHAGQVESSVSAARADISRLEARYQATFPSRTTTAT